MAASGPLELKHEQKVDQAPAGGAHQRQGLGDGLVGDHHTEAGGDLRDKAQQGRGALGGHAPLGQMPGGLAYRSGQGRAHRRMLNLPGFLHVLDVLLDSDRRDKTAKSYLRPVQLLEDSTPLDEVLPRMRIARQPAAFVTDQQGDMVGWLSVEDVLDELIGTI